MNHKLSGSGVLMALRAGMVVAAMGVGYVGFAQSASELVSRFGTLLGNDRYARFVWQRQSGGLPNFSGESANKIMAMDSKFGEIRELVGTNDNKYKSDATFTWDGLRVIYFVNASEEVFVVDFAGGTPRFLTNGTGGGHCWRSGTTDYALVVSGNDLYKVNIDDAQDKTKILDGEAGSDNNGVAWASLSPDGQYIAGAFPYYPNVGIAQVNGSPLLFNPGGCWPTIARDNTHDVLYTIEPHESIRIANQNGGDVLEKNLGEEIYGDGNASEYECLRWTPDRDFITLISFHETGEGGTCAGIPNPKLVKVSTLQHAAIVDNPAGSEGNTDVFFYTGDGTPARKESKRQPRFADANAAGFGLRYDCKGRRIMSPAMNRSGIHVSEAGIEICTTPHKAR